MAQGPLCLPQAVPASEDRLGKGIVQAFPVSIEIILKAPVVKDSELRCGRRRRRAEVGDKICDHRIRLMADGGDDGCHTFKDSFSHPLLIEGPQVLQGSSPAPDDDHIDPEPVQRPDAPDNTVRRRVSLYNGWIEDDPDIRVASFGNLDDIPHSCPCGSCHYSQSTDIAGNGLFIGLIEHPLLQQFLFEKLELLRQLSDPVTDDPDHVELIAPRALINIDRPLGDHLVPVLHGKRKPPSTACEHDAG